MGSLFLEDLSECSYIYLAIAIVFAIGLIVYEVSTKLRLVYIIVSLICMIMCFALGSASRYNYISDRAYFDDISDKETITFQGTLQSKEKKTASYYLYFDNISTNDSTFDPKWTIILVSDSDDLSLGTHAFIKAEKIQFNTARNEGNFDEKDYYNSIGSICKVKGTIVKYDDSTFSIREFFYQIREKIKSVYADYLPGEEAGIVSAMCLGDKSDLDAQVKDIFKLSGLFHILAISGLHISIVGMGIYKLLKKCGLSFLISGIISAVLVIVYGMITQAGVSTIRAVGMFIIMIIANVAGQGYDSISAVGALLIYVVLMYPYCIDSAGFVFSFGTVTGIAVVVNPLITIYDKYIRIRFIENNKGKAFSISVKERLIKALMGGVLIQMVTLPMVCYYYYEVPTLVVFLNLIVIPFLGILLSVTLLGGVFGVIAMTAVSLIGNIFSLVCELLLMISHIIVYVYELLAYNSLMLPFSRLITGQPSYIKIVIYYVILIVVTRYIVYCAKDIEKFIKQDHLRLRRQIIVASMGLIVIAVSIVNNDNRSDFELDMIDVGQGDGIYVGGGSVNYFFDGGSTNVKNVGTYRILPFLKYKGIRSIDYWFVSHTDEDHISGLLEALDASYSIDNIVVDKYMLGENNYIILSEKAKKNNTKIIVMNKGDYVSEGDCRLKCIFAGDDSIDDINANSLVLLGEYISSEPISFIIGGDMTAESEKIMLSDDSVDMKSVDILKVGHHGSKTSSSKEFIEAVLPKVSLISAGINNSYGHPHEITIQTLESVGTGIYRTDKNGRIRVDLSAKKVLTFL